MLLRDLTAQRELGRMLPPLRRPVTRFTATPENKAALLTAVPLGSLGLSEEPANAIVFIASDEALFITGHVLNVDGGKTAN
jgi:NAD(P)-dependent dehydrogenase (short-subunit alcohol dehydrogenase family)